MESKIDHQARLTGIGGSDAAAALGLSNWKTPFMLWEGLRLQNVGASEVAALYNESPYISLYQLWHIKKGLMEAPNLDDVERIEAGNWLEPAIIAWANKKYGTDFYQPKVYVTHKTVRGMGCTPDAFSQNDDLTIAQCKNVDSFVFARKESKWESNGDIITQCPLDIFLQSQHEMACTGALENQLIVLVGGNHLCRMIVKRNDVVISSLEKNISMFWESIDANDPPPPDYKRDGESIIEVKGQVPVVEYVDLSGDNQLADAAAMYIEASEIIKNAEERKEEAKAHILDKTLAVSSVVTCGSYEIKLVRKSGIPDKEITADMVGTVIKGRSSSVYPKVKQL